MSEDKHPTFQAEGFYGRFRSVFEPCLAEADLDPSVLSDPDAPVPLAKHARLLNLVAERLEDDTFGLHLGLKFRPSDMGAVGFAVMNSATVREALENLARYLSAYTRGCSFELVNTKDMAYYDFSYSIPELGILERRQEAELTLSLVMNIVRIISGKNWTPVEVCFEHPRPDQITEHKRIFGAPIRFGQPVNRLVFKREFLDNPVVEASPRLYTVIAEHLEKVIGEQLHESDFVQQVSNIVARELSNGVPTIDWVAEQLALTRRTLQRRLEDKGVGFSEIVDQVRRNLALEYVQKSSMSLTEVAYLLGYSHLSAFCRSFRRWTDTTPQKMRSQQDG
jgi:AraC-like DNA-binding protein